MTEELFDERKVCWQILSATTHDLMIMMNPRLRLTPISDERANEFLEYYVIIRAIFEGEHYDIPRDDLCEAVDYFETYLKNRFYIYTDTKHAAGRKLNFAKSQAANKAEKENAAAAAAAKVAAAEAAAQVATKVTAAIVVAAAAIVIAAAAIVAVAAAVAAKAAAVTVTVAAKAEAPIGRKPRVRKVHVRTKVYATRYRARCDAAAGFAA